MRHWYRAKQTDLVRRASRLQHTFQNSPWGWLGGAATIAAAGMLLLNARRLLWALRRRRLAVRPEKFPCHAATIWYERMTDTMARSGWPKSPPHTAQEFLKTIEDEDLQRKVALFIRRYEAARFADSAIDARELPGLYEEISRTTRQVPEKVSNNDMTEAG
jgi:hypothetical protein